MTKMKSHAAKKEKNLYTLSISSLNLLLKIVRLIFATQTVPYN